MLNNDPDWDPKLFAGNRRLYYGRWTYKYESAARQGAAGAIIIHTTPSAGYPWQVVQSSWSGEQFELPADDEPRVQVQGWATEEATRRMLAAGGHRPRQAGRPRRSRATSSPCRSASAPRSRSQNKICRRCRRRTSRACCPGSDPKLKDEVVIYSAHHDHLGIGEPDATGDKIYNGAMDNAAGCAQMLAIAQRVRGAAAKAAALDAVPVRRRRRAGAARLAVLRAPSDVPGGQDRGQPQLRRRQHLGPHEGLTLIGLGKSSLDEVAQR